MKISFSLVVKVVSFIFVAGVCLLWDAHVKAESIYAAEYVGQVYIKKEKAGVKKYLRSQYMRRGSDGQFMYCLDPWINILDNNNYNVLLADQYSEIKLSKEVVDKLRLIAYYGYGYPGHEDENWYTITQMLIWKTVDPEADFYYTDRLNGNRVEKFTQETQELENLVARHYTLPSFAQKTIESSIKRELVLEDKNGVLKNFLLIDNNDLVVDIKDNKLFLQSDEELTAVFKLKNTANLYGKDTLFYICENSQDAMVVGNYQPIETYFKVYFKSGSISLRKLDSESKDNQVNLPYSLENAVYELYDENGNYIDRIITDKKGMASISNLPLGKYTLKEKKASYGYLVDPKTYDIELTIENCNQTIDLFEEKIKKELIINKFYLDNQIYAEANVEFAIYDMNNTLIDTVITDENGKATISLELGKYMVKQLSTKEGYEKVDDFMIEVTLKQDKIIKNLYDNKSPTITVEVPDTYADSNKYSLLNWLFMILKSFIFLGIVKNV